jgi:hypothetical protein
MDGRSSAFALNKRKGKDRNIFSTTAPAYMKAH